MSLSYRELASRIADIVVPLNFEFDDYNADYSGDPMWVRDDGTMQTLITLETSTEAPSLEVTSYDNEKTLVSTTTFFLPDEDEEVWEIFENDFRKELTVAVLSHTW